MTGYDEVNKLVAQQMQQVMSDLAKQMSTPMFFDRAYKPPPPIYGPPTPSCQINGVEVMLDNGGIVVEGDGYETDRGYPAAAELRELAAFCETWADWMDEQDDDDDDD